MKRKHIVEIAAALLIVAILFAVMVPQFIKAQQLTYVSRALRDMAAISQAMQAYNLDQASDAPAHRLQKALINNENHFYPNSPLHRIYTYNTDWKLTEDETFMRLPFRSTKETELLSPTYNVDEKPPLKGNYRFRDGDYYAVYFVASAPAIQMNKLLIPISSIEYAWRTQTFIKEKNSSAFVGYCRGPHYGLPKANSQNPQVIHDLDHWYQVTQSDVTKKVWGVTTFIDDEVEYSPTNGVESHGYVVYRSAAPATEDIDDYFPGLKIKAAESPY
jgi:type II secretory pathway pseudopilin PulG